MQASQITSFFRLFGTLVITSITISSCSLTNVKLGYLGSLRHSSDKIAPLSDYDAQLLDPLCNISPEQLAALPPLNRDNLWDRIREGYTLPVIVNARINTQAKWYAKHPKYLERVTNRGAPYLYHIVEQIEARNIPFEIALLPIVESAFDPFAYSHGRASGIWQIIPGTGTDLGLKQNWWYDGRRDIVASTNAALNYLESLNKRFDGDWLLALAAYNSGAGNVNKAIRKNKRLNKPLDFWNLDLPKETKDYVPRLLALARLVAAPEQYKISLPTIDNTQYFAQVSVGSQIDLAHAAELAEIEMDEFYRLNPAFNRWASDPDGPYELLLPIERQALFEKKLSQIPQEERIAWQQYTIKKGDTLSTISKKYNLTIDGLKSINDINNNRIITGETLIVPIASQNASHYSLSATQRSSNRLQRSEKNAKGDKIVHTVREGDSLWDLSLKHKVSVRQIASWNSMAPGDPIYPGKKLTIWSKSKKPTTTASTFNSPKIIRKLSYRVRSGDSLARIASKFNVHVKDIVGWNDLKVAKYLQPGQALTLYIDVKRH